MSLTLSGTFTTEELLSLMAAPTDGLTDPDAVPEPPDDSPTWASSAAWEQDGST